MTEKPSGTAPDPSLIAEAPADRRRAPELDLSQRAVPTPEQNQKARSHPGVSPIFNEMLRNREDARVRWIEDCRRRSGVCWSGLSDREPPPILMKTFDQMIDDAFVLQAQRAAYAVSPRGLMSANMAAMKHPAAAVMSLSSEVESCISRGLTGRDRIAARERLGEIQHQLESLSWETSKALAILDVLDAENDA